MWREIGTSGAPGFAWGSATGTLGRDTEMKPEVIARVYASSEARAACDTLGMRKRDRSIIDGSTPLIPVRYTVAFH